MLTVWKTQIAGDEFIKRLEEVQIPEDEKEAKEYFEKLRKKMHWCSNRPERKEDILETATKTYLLYAISKNCNADEYSAKIYGFKENSAGIMEVENSLEAEQAFVGGLIEVYRAFKRVYRGTKSKQHRKAN